ncbi:multidrug resistance-associated protein 4 isoform X1 [Nasonia vitripennis]|uniref:Uncharacterized protein n=1 Tax=Nasonia vitripennis TaxID=7425 RepID=A0A7M7H601_NASVI|nr:multidrug resistance-associated protein 4 isoform X1 [Nasonia vitripennis]
MNIFNKLFFWWLKPIFFREKHKSLDVDDLHNVLPEFSSKSLGDRLESAWFEELKNHKFTNRKPSLFQALCKTFGGLFWYYSIHVFIICVILRGLLPFTLGLLIWHFDSRSDSTTQDACLCAVALLAMIVLQAMVGHHSVAGRKEVGMRISIAISSLVHRKILRLSISSSNEFNTGSIINILSNDVAKFEDVCMFWHYVWVLPIQGIVMAYFIWNNVGVSSLAGIFFLVIQTVPVQKHLAKVTAKIRAKVASKTDERVRLMSEIVRGIRVIKMYTWEKPFENLVFLARRYEVDAIAVKSYMRGVSAATSVFAESTSMFFIIMTYVLLGNALEASVVYSVAQYFSMIKVMITVFYPRALSSAAEARVSLKRIEDFLFLDEVDSKMNLEDVKKRKGSARIIIEDLSASWSRSTTEQVLQNINLKISAGELCILAGPTGSGKSTLLKTILGELQVNSGQIKVDGQVSYASQEPWLFAGTVKNNILFGQDYDKEKYDRVVSACALKNDFESLLNGDETYVGDRGAMLSGGQCARVNLARAIYRDADIYLIDDALAAVDSKVGKFVFDNCINGLLKEKIKILITHNFQYFQEADQIIVINDGQIDYSGTFSHLIDYRLLELPQHTSSPVVNKTPLKDESSIQNGLELKFTENKSTKVMIDEKDKLLKSKQLSTSSMCWRYFRAGGSIFALLCLVLNFVLAQASVTGCDYWLAHWIKQEESQVKTHTNNSSVSIELRFALYVFAGLLLASVIMWTASSLFYYKICMTASRKLHNQMFSCLLKSPMRFYEINPSGRILNRFSKDIGLVDETLPTTTLDALQVLLKIIGVSIQVLIINWWSIVPMIIMSTSCWKLKNVYLPTAQNIKRLESKAKSPVYSHVNSTMSGLATIRSAEAQEKLKAEFDSLQNVHTSAHYLNIVSSSAFGFYIDILSVSLLAFVVFCFIILKDSNTFAGIVGLAITQILMLYGSVQYGLRQTTEMMTQMISVERIFQFTSLEQEGPFVTNDYNTLSKNWPQNGQIKFDHLSLKYSDEDELVLKDINLSVRPGEKIGVVGRTGTGKSSLISALFRLVNSDGSIFIDDIDIKKIGLHDLRSRISIIPQDPVLFTATLRTNLDPAQKYNDDVIWQALEDVELKSKFNTLDHQIENGGNNLSTGQKQLLCLARVIMAKNKILILDEATANVDLSTDEIIQKTIRMRFSNCTIITIAHRLNTILDSDKILVIHQGEAVEFNTPQNLLQLKDGYFSNMMNCIL